MVAHRVPLPDFGVELSVEHAGFEASPYIAFTAKDRGQLFFLAATPNILAAVGLFVNLFGEQMREGSLLVKGGDHLLGAITTTFTAFSWPS